MGMNTSPSSDAPRRVRAFLTVADAAWLLQVRPASVRSLVQSGELPADRTTHGWRIAFDDIQPILKTLDARAALRSLRRGEIAVPRVPNGARPLPLDAAIPSKEERS